MGGAIVHFAERVFIMFNAENASALFSGGAYFLHLRATGKAVFKEIGRICNLAKQLKMDEVFSKWVLLVKGYFATWFRKTVLTFDFLP